MGGRRAEGTRERMLVSAVQLIRERGVAGATVDAILAHSSAPRGSVYYHFPGGRTQIITEAIDYAGEWIAGVIERASAASDTKQMLGKFIETWKKILHTSEFAAGCPVAAVAVDGVAIDEALRMPAAVSFGRWRAALTERVVADGADPLRAARFANIAIASIEGAILLCRVELTTDPLDDVRLELESLLDVLV